VGRYSSRPPHVPATELLNEPLVPGDAETPSTIEAIIRSDFRDALAGNREALKDSLNHLKRHLQRRIRAESGILVTHQDVENEYFERIDDVLDLLGIVSERIIQKESRETDQYTKKLKKKLDKRVGPGIAEWVLEAANAHPDCPELSVDKVTNWIGAGCPMTRFHYLSEDTEWT